MTQSSRPRHDEFPPYYVVDIVEELIKARPDRYVKENLKYFSIENSTIV
jgi:hypothetical protein